MDLPTETGSERVRSAVDDALRSFLERRDGSFADHGAEAAPLVGEIRRLVEAGGGRMRPVLCVWGFVAGGGVSDDPRIVRAAAALELLHTMALIHDDLIDGADTRRGVATVHVHAASPASTAGTAGGEAVGRSVALLAGDLAAVLADELIASAGFDPATTMRARAVYDEMRIEMAAGQAAALLGGPPADRAEALRRAALRGGGYSVEGPLRFGAALASATQGVVAALSVFGGALGRAFQLADDLRDGDAAAGVDAWSVRSLVDQATSALVGLPEEADLELRSIAAAVKRAAGPKRPEWGGPGMAGRRRGRR